MYYRSGLILLSVVLVAGCQQQMAKQPSYRPLAPSDYFPDGRSARPLVAGTVARDQLAAADPVNTGLLSAHADAGRAAATAAGALAPFGAVAAADVGPALDYVTTFPVPVDEQLLARGRERFTIFCSVCHDTHGTGHGKIVERGFTRPPSWITDESRGLARRGIHMPLREVPVGYIFEVITRGYGAMPDYRSQVAARDRWAIIAYVRALQLSQYAELTKLPPEVRKEAEEALGGKP